LPALRHIDYGYATTSHSSQGATIDRVLVNVDTEQSVALVNQQQFYVSISRARVDAQVFTNKKDELAQAVSRAWPKSTALDAVTLSDSAPRLSPQQNRGRQRRVTAQQKGQGERDARQTPPRALITLSPRERPLMSVYGRQPVDAAQLVSHHQINWRRDQQHTGHERTVTRTPDERRSERPASQREEPPTQQPEHRRGIRYRR
jgi:hypothetical protein